MMGFRFGAHGAAPRDDMTAKLAKLKGQLAALAQKTAASGKASDKVGGNTPHTVSDDGEVPADVKLAITRDETVVRAALKKVGVDYDALIATEGNTPYALALRANPALARDILAAENPVLAALDVAVAYKPYAEFGARYGTEPEAIKAAILAEHQNTRRADAEPAPKAALGPLFSRAAAGPAAPAAPVAKSKGLDGVFRK